MSKFLLAVGAIPLLLYLSILALMYFFQERLIFLPSRLAKSFEFSFKLPFREHYLPVGDAVLHGLVFEKPNAIGTIVYFHGNAGALNSWGDVSYDFERFPYHLVIFDYRGYGKSSGIITSEKVLQDDAEAIHRFVDDTFGEGERIIVGRSIGTGVASWLAAKYPPKLLVLETPYETLPDLVKIIYPFVPRFLVRYELANREWIRNQPYPIELIHGDRDDLIPHRCSQQLAKIGPHIRLNTIEGGAHNNISSFPAYHETLTKIFQVGSERP